VFSTSRSPPFTLRASFRRLLLIFALHSITEIIYRSQQAPIRFPPRTANAVPNSIDRGLKKTI
jgi:hypothetical protein